MYYKRIDTCLGRLILNSNVPQDMGFKRRNTLNDMFALEIDMKVGKKQLGQIVDMCFRKHGVAETARVLDNVKAMGYKYSTIGAVTVAVADVIVPPEKKPILEEAEKAGFARSRSMFKRGLLAEEERYNRVVEVWSKTDRRRQGQDYGSYGRVQPDPHDDRLRRPWFYLSDFPACRHARHDGVPDRPPAGNAC